MHKTQFILSSRFRIRSSFPRFKTRQARLESFLLHIESNEGSDGSEKSYICMRNKVKSAYIYMHTQNMHIFDIILIYDSRESLLLAL